MDNKTKEKYKLEAWKAIIAKAKEVNELAKKRGLTIRFTYQIK